MFDLSHVPELASLGRVLGRFETAARDLSDRSVIVGATARDLILHHVHQLPITRATRDLDIAVAVGSWEAYSELAKKLVDGGARSDPKVTHRFFVSEWKIDVVPFGSVEQNGVIVWPRVGNEMSVAGFHEASQHALEVLLPGDVQAFVASPPALLMLKVIAWEERHLTDPRHDAVDIKTLLESYAAPWNQDRLYDEADDLLRQFGYDNTRAGAALLGRDTAAIARTETLQRLRDILDREISTDELILASDMGRDPEANLTLLEALRVGIEDSADIRP